ncbi:DNA integrity scanning diadenylate cyclase DisA [Patescibacteria group bacterium]|nr:DNA integrity scanning diadenylate cyclase DisA [Patescibacteria group bacterium]
MNKQLSKVKEKSSSKNKVEKNRIPLEEKSLIPEVKKSMTEVLKIFSPGTAIRTALDDILRAEMGALIVFETEGLMDIVEGGFKIDCRFSPQKLVELAKMDGAIILSRDLKKIIYANTSLTPEARIVTKETGTRHKAAERTAKQFKTIVAAISERKKKITLYFDNESHFLEETSEILRRAAETLQILEKQREIFEDLLSHLNVLEITNLTTMEDVCNVLQTAEIMRRISENVKRYLIELGKEGMIVSMRLKELTKNLNKEKDSILEDYFGLGWTKKEEILHNINFDVLLETSNILRILFGELHDMPIVSGGKRILSKTNLMEKDIQTLLYNFKTLDKIINLEENSLRKIFNNEDSKIFFLDEIKNLKEKILMGKKF